MTAPHSCRLAVMLSTGRHPVSGRARISSADRRAIGVALAAGCGPATAVHAGMLDAVIAHDAFGMGLAAVQALRSPDVHADVMPALLGWWQRRRPDVSLFGTQTETGAGSGALPYFFAQAVGLPVVSGLVHIAEVDGHFELTQALSASSRRLLRVDGPFVGIASPRAVVPLAFSHAAAQAGRFETLEIDVASGMQGTMGTLVDWQEPSIDATVLRPRSLRSDMELSLDERLGGILGRDNALRQRYLNASPDDAARVILDTLQGLGLVKINRG